MKEWARVKIAELVPRLADARVELEKLDEATASQRMRVEIITKDIEYYANTYLRNLK